MAWKDLDPDLSDMFGEFTSRADVMLDALDVRRSARYEYQKQWELDNRWRRKLERERAKPEGWVAKTTKKHGPVLPDWLRKERARDRANASYARNKERARALTLARVRAYRARNAEKLREYERERARRLRAAKKALTVA